MSLTESSSRRYRGKVAQNYDEIRSDRRRWLMENNAVESMMEGASGSVLDVACGTGRFFPLYERLVLTDVVGMDASPGMLVEAQKKLKRAMLIEGDARHLLWADNSFDYVVCIRLLNLVEEEAMVRIVAELCRVAHSKVVLTIRFGETYEEKKTTAIHSRKRFNSAVKRAGWRIAREVPVLRWHVVELSK